MKQAEAQTALPGTRAGAPLARMSFAISWASSTLPPGLFSTTIATRFSAPKAARSRFASPGTIRP
jgi:hypothetical protein